MRKVFVSIRAKIRFTQKDVDSVDYDANGDLKQSSFDADLYVGNQEDYEDLVANNLYCEDFNLFNQWAFVLAAKEPWHRNELMYTGRSAPKEHPEYLMAKRDSRLILNLVDAPKPEFFNKKIIDAALDFIDEQLRTGKNVLVCCNQGESRSPSIALLYMIKHGIIKGDTLEECEAAFMQIYPEYNPGIGMRGFVKEHWREYCG